MKKIFLLITLFILPIVVNAKSFKYGDAVYVLEERKVECVPKNYTFMGLTKNEEPIFIDIDGSEDIVKVNKENKCEALTAEEFLDLEQYSNRRYKLEKKDNGDYVIKSYVLDQQMSFIKTEDKKVVEGKEYFEVGDSWHGTVIPTDETVRDYYESVVLIRPSSYSITDETYYQKTSNDLIYEKVETPVLEDILNYYVIEPKVEKTFDVLNSDNFKKIENFDKIIEDEDYNIIVNEAETNFFIDLETEEYRKFYGIDGLEIKLFENSYSISFLTNDLFVLSTPENIKIYTSDFELLYTNDDYIWINPIEYMNYRYYLDLIPKANISESNIYYLSEYKLLEGADQTYSNEDLTFKFSGRLDKLGKVELNGKELDAKNFRTKSGSTIITINNDYLKTLAVGEYELKLTYNDGGYSNVTFKVEEKKEESVVLPENPETSDSITLMFSILTMSIISASLIILIKKRTQ